MSFPIYKNWEVRIPNKLKFTNITIYEDYFTYHVKAVFIDLEENETIVNSIEDDNGIAYLDYVSLSSQDIPNMSTEEEKQEAIMNWFLTTEGYTILKPQFGDFA